LAGVFLFYFKKETKNYAHNFDILFFCFLYPITETSVWTAETWRRQKQQPLFFFFFFIWPLHIKTSFHGSHLFKRKEEKINTATTKRRRRRRRDFFFCFFRDSRGERKEINFVLPISWGRRYVERDFLSVNTKDAGPDAKRNM
jgi:hypothetical protein